MARVTESAIWRLHQKVFVFLLVLDFPLIEPLIIFRIKLFKVSICFLSSTSIHINVPLPLNSSQLFPSGWLDSYELGNTFNQNRNHRLRINSSLWFSLFPEWSLRLFLLWRFIFSFHWAYWFSLDNQFRSVFVKRY